MNKKNDIQVFMVALRKFCAKSAERNKSLVNFYSNTNIRSKTPK